MPIVSTERWHACLDEIKKRVGASRFNLWFKSLELVEFEESRVVLGVPSAFIAEWLQTRFKSAIEEALYAVCGLRPQINFRVIGSLFKKLRGESLREGVSLIQKASEAQPSTSVRETSEVRPEFTLDTFVVGPCNEMAFAAAKDVGAGNKPMFNPIFFHGPSGVGKTHLLQGIYNEVRSRKAHLKVRYATAERFTNQYVFALKYGKLDSFRHMYREADILLIDDVQFFSNKMGFQEEFLHTFSAVVDRDHQVVLASDSHPRDLNKIHEGLASRFVSGMVIRLEPPQYATRLAIVRSKAARFAKQIDEEVFELIAHLCQGNVRELEGALTTVIACATLSGSKVDVNLARQVLHRAQAVPTGPINLDLVESLVLQEFGMTRDDLRSRRRLQSVSLPRQVAMYLARKWTAISAQEIGAFFGGRNHTTVLFAHRKIEHALATDKQLAYRIEKIEALLKSGRKQE